MLVDPEHIEISNTTSKTLLIKREDGVVYMEIPAGRTYHHYFLNEEKLTFELKDK